MPPVAIGSPTPMRDAAERRAARWALVAVLALLVALAIPPLCGRTPCADDLGAFHLPIRAFYAEQLARGEPFDWMPQLFGGFSLTGEGQAGGYHPLRWLLYRFLPLETAFGLEWWLPYPLMFVGTWLFLRRRLASDAAAMLGGLAFTFGGFCLLHAVHPNAIAVVAHLPWILWAAELVMSLASRVKVALAQAAVGALVASQLLLGYPQYVWFSLLALAGYTGLLAFEWRNRPRIGCAERPSCRHCVGCRRSAWPQVVIAVGAGVLLGGVQLLPTAEALGLSTRQNVGPDFAAYGSLHPLNLCQIVAPYLFQDRVLGGNTHELGFYVGTVPLVLAVWAVCRWRTLGRNVALAWWAVGLAVLALLLALGSYSPLHALQSHLPLLQSLRFPCRHVILFQFAVAILAALGFTHLLRQVRGAAVWRKQDGIYTVPSGVDLVDVAPEPTPWRRFEPLWAVFAVSAAVGLSGLLLGGHELVGPWWGAVVGPALVAAAVLLTVFAARGSAGALASLAVFAAIDLGCYGLSYAVFPLGPTLAERLDEITLPPGEPDGRVVYDVVSPPSHFNQPSAAQPPSTTLSRDGERVAAEPPGEGRVTAAGVFTGNESTLLGWSRADGYAGLVPKRRLPLNTHDALRVASVRWVARTPQSEQIAGLKPHDDRWLESPDPLPRVRLVARAQASDAPEQDIATIDVATTVLCDYPLALPKAEPGTAQLVAERPGVMAIAVTAPDTQLLVVSEAYHPGWQAWVDGDARQPVRVNGDYLGVPVEREDHDVILMFRPRSLWFGWINACVGFGVLAVSVITGLHRAEFPPEIQEEP